MDTRSKIIDEARAVEIARELRGNGGRLCVATGYFDVLMRDHARRLAERDQCGKLIVVVHNPRDPILAGRARAELVAALAVVDYVVLQEQGPEELLSRLEADQLIRGEEADEQRTQGLIQNVHARQRG